ncbi:MAG: adenylyl-sulfate kinase [Pseudomonadales bacterium]
MMQDHDLYVSGDPLDRLIAQSRELPSWDLTPRQACDTELLLNGAFAPLDGFMTGDECRSVQDKKRWQDHFWPLPVYLDVSEACAGALEIGDPLALRDQEGVLVAVITIADKFPASAIASDAERNAGSNPVCIGGRLQGIEAPAHHDFKRRRLSPRELRRQFDKLGWRKVLGYATRQPLHQREVNETYNASRKIEANLLLNPAVGAVQPEDALHYAQVHCYEQVLDHFPGQTTDLAILPLYSRCAGLDDALLHALVLKNLGCTHYMVDRGYCAMAETGMNYSQVQEALSAYNQKLGIELVFNERMVYSARRGGYVERATVADGELVNELTTEEFAGRLRSHLAVPDWYTWPEIVSELGKIYRPCSEQGVTIFFTGLSGSGKSSIANAVLVKMMEMGGRPITLLDGDVVRQNLSSELGFSKEHRDLNIRRIGYVASQITKHGGMAICAPIAPYTRTRRDVREMVEQVGGFVEVYVSTPLEICEQRDRKGLYAKARAGIIKEFTGISDPYEEPEYPEVRIDTEGISPEEAAQRVILTLEKLGYIKTI